MKGVVLICFLLACSVGFAQEQPPLASYNSGLFTKHIMLEGEQLGVGDFSALLNDMHPAQLYLSQAQNRPVYGSLLLLAGGFLLYNQFSSSSPSNVFVLGTGAAATAGGITLFALRPKSIKKAIGVFNKQQRKNAKP